MARAMGDNLQDRYAPAGTCFGCGPANDKGLRIKSVPREDEVVAEWSPAEHHEAFPGVLSGGIIGALLDCHSNWTAAHHLMVTRSLDEPPCTVTAEYAIKLRRPTPSNVALTMRAKVEDSEGGKVTVAATLEAGGKLCATCRGIFVAVQPDHPAYHRW